MLKFLKANKVVVLLQGRFAGRKAVVVKNFNDGRPYRHALIAGVDKYPRKVSQKKIAKRSQLKPFIGFVHYNHIMYTLMDVYLKNVVTPEKLDSKAKRVETRKETKALFEERFTTRKNKCP